MPARQRSAKNKSLLCDTAARENKKTFFLVYIGMTTLVACQDCDLINKIPPIPPDGSAKCVRCGAVLAKHKPDSLNRSLALLWAALILFIVANTLPFLAMKKGGLVHETTLATGIHELYGQGMWPIATLVLITCILAPLVEIVGMLYILIPLKLNRIAPFTALLYRFIVHIHPWSMMEIFMLGILVSLVKLGKMATIVPGAASISFAILIFVMAALLTVFDSHLIWDRLKEKAS